jgi:hypothetical protein
VARNIGLALMVCAVDTSLGQRWFSIGFFRNPMLIAQPAAR